MKIWIWLKNNIIWIFGVIVWIPVIIVGTLVKHKQLSIDKTWIIIIFIIPLAFTIISSGYYIIMKLMGKK